ncbi:hypothetical protein CUMW_251460 [Citrus unshiu]|uniref:Uncharacterized protein n=1 Tax=Citrus unshiu TaxID=55188 RepID=A0A2H5QQ91_CITUN|nr:hypothetical protein CUMW_251460 [Citrus unshiu]
MRSLLMEGLPVAEPKENETISRQQLAAGSEWRPLTKFPSSCNAITIILSLMQSRTLEKRVFSESLNPGLDGFHVIAKKVLISEAAVLFISLNPNPSLWISQTAGSQDSKGGLNFRRHAMILMAICQWLNAFSSFSFRTFRGAIK